MHLEPAAGLVYLLHISLIPFQDKNQEKKPTIFLIFSLGRPKVKQESTVITCQVNNVSSVIFLQTKHPNLLLSLWGKGDSGVTVFI